MPMQFAGIVANHIARAPIEIASMQEDHVSSLLATVEFAHPAFDGSSLKGDNKIFEVGAVSLRSTRLQKRLVLHADGLEAARTEAMPCRMTSPP
jgi:hypothetical protein